MITWRVPTLLLVLGGLTLWWVPSPWLVLALLTAAVALPAVVDLAVAAPPGEVRLARSGARQVRLGESATVTLTLTNDSPRPLRALVRDAWVPSAGASPPYAHLVELDPGASTDIDTVLTPTRRGDRPAVRVSIRSYGPFGCAYRQNRAGRARAATPEWTLRALPPFHSRRILPEKLSRLRSIDGQVTVRGRGAGTEFDGLRDYVIGDDVRAIDWRGTARREHPVVRTWRPERDRRVLLVLDTGRTSASRVGAVGSAGAGGTRRADGGIGSGGIGSGGTDGGAADGGRGPGDPGRTQHPGPDGGEPRLDSAIDAAQLLAAVATHAGDRVNLLAVDATTRVRLQTTGKNRVPARLTEALTSLDATLVETDFGRVVAEILRAERKRALVVLFTSLDPGALGEGLLPVLPQLVARHTVIVAAVHDPLLGSLAAARGTAAQIYTAAAAERGLAELTRVRAALARFGTHVVDAPAPQFASAVTDRYLALKAAGRL